MKVNQNVFLFLMFIISLALLMSTTIEVNVTCNSSFTVIDVYWGEKNNPIEVEPGDMGVPLTIVIRNDGTNAITNIAGELFLKYPFSGINAESSILTHYAGIVQPGSTFYLTFYINVDENADLGHYYLQLQLDFSEIIRGTYQSKSDSLSIKVPLLGKAKVSFNLNKVLILAGTTNNLELYISNIGSANAYNVKISIESTGQITLLNNTEIELNVIEPSSLTTIPIAIYAPSSSVGSKSSIIISTTYVTVYGFIKTVKDQINIGIPSLAESELNLDVGVDRYIIVGGDLNNTVKLRIKNNGNIAIKSLTVTMNLPSNMAILGDDNKWFIEELKPKSEIEIPVRIYAPSEAVGLSFQASIELRYKDEYEIEWVETRKIGFSIIGYVDLQLVSLAVSPSQIEVGGMLTISGSLRNDGISDAKGIKVSVSSEEDILEEVTMGATYIGSLSSGSQAPFSLSLRVKESTSSGQHTLTVIVTYKDELGKEHSSTWPIRITVIPKIAEKEGGRGRILGPELSIMITIAIVSFILGSIVSFMIYRRVLGKTEMEIGVEE